MKAILRSLAHLAKAYSPKCLVEKFSEARHAPSTRLRALLHSSSVKIPMFFTRPPQNRHAKIESRKGGGA
jgi:hypothetical protein